MTDDTQDIVARLRAKTVLHENFGGNGVLEQWNNRDGEEAADLIEAQTAEIERLRKALQDICMIGIRPYRVFPGGDMSDNIYASKEAKIALKALNEKGPGD